MKVYLDENGPKRLIGRADVPGDANETFEVPLFGAASTIVESFTIGAVRDSSGAAIEARAVIASVGQLVDLLPGWEPLSS